MNRSFRTLCFVTAALAAALVVGCTPAEDSSEGVPDDLPEQTTSADPSQAPSNTNAAENAPMEAL